MRRKQNLAHDRISRKNRGELLRATRGVSFPKTLAPTAEVPFPTGLSIEQGQPIRQHFLAGVCSTIRVGPSLHRPSALAAFPDPQRGDSHRGRSGVSRALAQAREQDGQFERNLAWLRSHASEVYSQHRGKCICISSEELFVADSARQAVALAKAAHPEDQGRFVRYIPREKVPRIYAH